MTAADIARLRELLSKATPGPWEYDDRGIDHMLNAAPWCETVVGMEETGTGYMRHDVLVLSTADAELIAAAVNSLPELLDGYEAAMAVVRKVATRKMPETMSSGGLAPHTWRACRHCDAPDVGREPLPFKHRDDCAWVAAVAMSEGE